MSGLWWIPAALGVWFALSLGMGLLLGPVLRDCSRARESVDQDVILMMDVQPSQE